MTDLPDYLPEYWRALASHIEHRCQGITPADPVSRTWIAHDFPWPGASLNVALVLKAGVIRVELFMDNEEAQPLFEHLHAQREAIEDAALTTLIWEAKPGVRRRKIYAKSEGLDFSARSTWKFQHVWIAETLGRLDDACRAALNLRLRGNA